MQMRRFTRLTNAFSKKFENHMHMVALSVWYNFVKQHKTLKGLSPAMAAGLSETLSSMTDLAEMVDAAQPKRGSADRTKSTRRRKIMPPKFMGESDGNCALQQTYPYGHTARL